MKVLGRFKLEDGSLTDPLPADELVEKHGDKCRKVMQRYFKVLLEGAYQVEVSWEE